MARGPYRLLIFDWDGTLRDSIGSIVGCAQEAAGEHGFAASGPVIRGSVGLGLDTAIGLWCPGADDETRRLVRESYRRLWVERWQSRADLFPMPSRRSRSSTAAATVLEVERARRGEPVRRNNHRHARVATNRSSPP